HSRRTRSPRAARCVRHPRSRATARPRRRDHARPRGRLGGMVRSLAVVAVGRDVGGHGIHLALSVGMSTDPSAKPTSELPRHTHNHVLRYFQTLGPGLVTGASDDDPSGIATYSVAGAAYGVGLLWTALFTFPLMAAIQLVCARIGLVTGRGLAGAVRQHYP